MMQSDTMRAQTIIEFLEDKYPSKAAEDWDNPGLLCGRRDVNVKTIFVALDVTDETLAEALECKADFIVTHHPLIFSGIKKVNEDSIIGRRLLTMIENHMTYFAMHTNFDICGMADLNAKQIGIQDTVPLEVTDETDSCLIGLGKTGYLQQPMTLYEYARRVKMSLGIGDIRMYGNPEKIVSKAAMCSGSGKSLVKEVLKAGADVYITGDMDYHTAIDAVAEGLAILDAGHYGTEFCFIEYMVEELKKQFPMCNVIGATVKQPYQIV